MSEPVTPPGDRTLPPRKRRLGSWSVFLGPAHTYHGDPDDDACIASYPEPEWRFWLDRVTWDLLKEFVPLLLGHCPKAASRAPYLNLRWCEEHPERSEVALLELVITSAGMEFGQPRMGGVGGSRYVVGWNATPAQCIAWARSKRSIILPPTLLKLVQQPKLSGWTGQLAQLLQQDEPEHAVAYPEPEWRYWIDRTYWQTLTTVPPLLLGHDPRSALRAPYFNAGWCEAHPDRPEVRVMKVVVTAIIEGTLGIRAEGDLYPGYRVRPLDAVTWARAQLSIEPPAQLLKAAALKEERLAASVKPLSPPMHAALPNPDDVPLPGITKPEIWRSFVIYVSQRCAGLTVPANKDGSMQLLGENEPTIASYAGSKFPEWYAPIERYAADTPGGWGAVFEALRRKHPLAG